MTYMKSYVWWHLTTIVVNLLDLAVVASLTQYCVYIRSRSASATVAYGRGGLGRHVRSLYVAALNKKQRKYSFYFF